MLRTHAGCHIVINPVAAAQCEWLNTLWRRLPGSARPFLCRWRFRDWNLWKFLHMTWSGILKQLVQQTSLRLPIWCLLRISSASRISRITESSLPDPLVVSKIRLLKQLNWWFGFQYDQSASRLNFQRNIFVQFNCSIFSWDNQRLRNVHQIRPRPNPSLKLTSENFLNNNEGTQNKLYVAQPFIYIRHRAIVKLGANFPLSNIWCSA